MITVQYTEGLSWVNIRIIIIAYLQVTSSHSPVSLIIVLISGFVGKDATPKSACQDPSRSYGFSIPLSDLAKI